MNSHPAVPTQTPCNSNTDGDAFSDREEVECGSDPRDNSSLCTGSPDPDADNDGIADWWEALNCTSTGGDCDPTDHQDADTCDNLCEYRQGTDPEEEDTDGDGLWDDAELPDSSPTLYDTDGDGLNDKEEQDYIYPGDGVNYPLNARSPDTDGDGLEDDEEATWSGPYAGCSINAADEDTDDDGVNDGLEVSPGSFVLEFASAPAYQQYIVAGFAGATNPCDQDTDDDYWTDFREIFVWSDYGMIADPVDDDTDGDGIADGLDSSDTTLSNTAGTD